MGWELPGDWDAADAAEASVDSVEDEALESTVRPGALPDRKTDRRETEAWFLRLPDVEQQRLRERWRWESDRFGEFDEWASKMRYAAMRDAVLIMTIGQVLQLGNATTPSVIAGTCVGLAVGWIWARIEAGRLGRAATSAFAFFGLQLLFPGWTASSSLDPSPAMFVMFGALAVIVASAGTGLLYERNVMDGPSS